jgi:valyl-tRNA synthetase
MKVGRRLAVKLLNASKFALAFGEVDGPEAEPGQVTEPVDRALLGRLADVVDEATAAFDASDYTRALERTEAFFWSYCDDYIELVKGRAYGTDLDPAASANRALRMSLDVLLRLFAPVLPFATEEVWSWWRDGSVHAQPWPSSAPLRQASGTSPSARNERPQDVLDVAAVVLERVRGEKSRAKTSMKTPVLALHATGSADDITRLNEVAEDLRNACLIDVLTGEAADGPFTVATIELGEAPAKPTRSAAEQSTP